MINSSQIMEFYERIGEKPLIKDHIVVKLKDLVYEVTKVEEDGWLVLRLLPSEDSFENALLKRPNEEDFNI